MPGSWDPKLVTLHKEKAFSNYYLLAGIEEAGFDLGSVLQDNASMRARIARNEIGSRFLDFWSERESPLAPLYSRPSGPSDSGEISHVAPH